MTDISSAQQAMSHHVLYDHAANLLIQQQRVPGDAIDILVEQGFDRESATVVVEELDNEISKARKQQAQKDILYGSLWCIGGIALTMAEVGFIFWGAILFGAIQLIKGLTKL